MDKSKQWDVAMIYFLEKYSIYTWYMVHGKVSERRVDQCVAFLKLNVSLTLSKA
jgi:hypothetical protein